MDVLKYRDIHTHKDLEGILYKNKYKILVLQGKDKNCLYQVRAKSIIQLKVTLFHIESVRRS